MPVYAYTASDHRQTGCSGTLAADTPALARQALRQRGLTIASIEPVTSKKSVWPLLPRPAARHAESIAELWRNLAVLLEAGVPLSEALHVCLRQQRGPLQTVVRQLHEAVGRGSPLTDALAKHRDWFDSLSLALVRVGEQSGNLSSALTELAEYQTRRRSTANRLATALIYPAILCVVGTTVVVFLTTHVVPQLIDVLASAGRELPLPTRILKAVSDGLLGAWPLLAVIAAGAIVGLTALHRTLRGRRILERLVLSIPVLGDLVRKRWVAQISMMLAALLKADVRFTEALRTVRRSLPHGLYADQLGELERCIEAGSPIAEPLRDSKLMPPLVVHLLAVGQESGELPGMLAQLRDAYEKSVQLALTRFLAVLEPALIVVLALLIGFVVFATLLPILETTKVVQ